MTHKEIKNIEDKNLKKIMIQIKKLESNQKKLHKIINKDYERINDDSNSI
jgi:hypothetical protein